MWEVGGYRGYLLKAQIPSFHGVLGLGVDSIILYRCCSTLSSTMLWQSISAFAFVAWRQFRLCCSNADECKLSVEEIGGFLTNG